MCGAADLDVGKGNPRAVVMPVKKVEPIRRAVMVLLSRSNALETDAQAMSLAKAALRKTRAAKRAKRSC